MHSTSDELKILILHGMLHLAGYDHEKDHGEMSKKERRLRESLNLPVGLIERNTIDSEPSGLNQRSTKLARRRV